MARSIVGAERRSPTPRSSARSSASSCRRMPRSSGSWRGGSGARGVPARTPAAPDAQSCAARRCAYSPRGSSQAFFVADVVMKRGSVNKVVLAYSGGLDTSIILKWLQTTYGCEVVTFTADLGQGEEIEPARQKALLLGIKPHNVFIEDLREEFVRDYVFPMFRANALYEGQYLLGTSIARPLIAKKQIEIAEKVGADVVAHGATGKGNDQVRFELTYYALKPDVTVIAPWREWEFKGRSDLIAYEKEHKIPVTATHEKPYSTDRNLMHISYEGGILEDPWAEPPDNIFQLSRSPEQAKAEAEYIEISFVQGEPVAINGRQMDAVKILETANTVGGE